jgi:hypothetical protein
VSALLTHHAREAKTRGEKRGGKTNARALFCTIRDKLSPTDPRCSRIEGDTSTSSTVHTFLVTMISGPARTRGGAVAFCANGSTYTEKVWGANF